MTEVVSIMYRSTQEWHLTTWRGKGKLPEDTTELSLEVHIGVNQAKKGGSWKDQKEQRMQRQARGCLHSVRVNLRI